MPRDPTLRPYRIAVYCAYGLLCAFIFGSLIRSVIGDLYGRRPNSDAQASPTACLEDVERLYAALVAVSLLGFILTFGLDLTERWAIPWRRERR